ncbi:MAG TPA: hypothetical protein PKD77_00720 [Rudaea sp.]|nr:hypothetical protein [Rudaea sp.]
MRFRFRLALAALILLAAGSAFAACTTLPVLLPFHYRVGADTTHCQYNDIQSAINAVGECPTVIDITHEHTYMHQHLHIDNKPNLTLQGWGDGVTCAMIPGNLDFPPYSPPASTQPLLSIDGSSDGGGSVLYVTGNSNVGLHNLTVLRGANLGSDDNNSVGGGIHFDGQGSLYLTRSTISTNEAGFGGGIDVNGSSGPVALTLDANTLVISNTADTSGGGIRVRGNTRLYALKPGTLIGYNHAPNGYGGGIEVLGPARADIGSPGYGGLGVIYGNDAAYGGGMDILNFGDSAPVIARLFTTDPANPVQVSDNFASHTGGAFYLRPYEAIGSAGGAAVLCANDFRIEDNVAQEGAAIYADADYDGLGNPLGGYVSLNTDPDFVAGSANHPCITPEPTTALGAVACAADVTCNTLTANKAEDGSGNPTAGATILLQSDGKLWGDRFSMRANTGAHVLREIGDTFFSDAILTNCLLADDVLTRELIAQTDGTNAAAKLDSCTIAGNTIGAPYVFLAPGYLFLRNSIIDQPGHATADPAITDSYNAAYLLTNDRSTLPNAYSIEQGEPSFVDAANGNYHLLPTSLGVDFAPVDSSFYVTTADLDRNPRIVDLPNVFNGYGPMDLGAYEVQRVFACGASDTIYCDGFEP